MALDATGRVGAGPRRMIAVLGVTTLVLVAGPPPVSPAAAGGAHLKPPHSVEVSITDDTFTLRWASGSDPGRDVTFSAEYQMQEINDWIKLPGCQYVASTSCDCSSLKINVYDEIKLRIRAEEGNSTSPWHELGPFIPHEEARLGPPGVHLEAEDKAIIVSISPPGGQDSLMWAMDKSNFKYSVVHWQGALGAQKTNETVYPRYLMNNLSPETTYCVKVKAKLYLLRKPASESPVYCVNTTVEDADKLPPPENVQVSGKGQDFVLHWNHTFENVTFQVQWLPVFLKKIPGNYEEKWTQVKNCENVRTAQCVFPRNTFGKGTYFLRVRASGGSRTSPWSDEKEFHTDSLTVVPPPVVVLKAVDNSSLRVYVGAPSESAYQRYPLTYEIIFWENTSNAERKIVEKRTDFTIPNLKALTVYCVRARALLWSRRWNSSSEFSGTVCERTRPGDSPSSWLVAVACMVVTGITALCALGLWKLVNYVFFPNRTPPSTINEYVSEQSLKNILLSASEEQTEKCFIIENIETVATVEETNQTGEGHKMYNSQTSEDSGNYSNEDENSGSRPSEDLGQEGRVWQG